MNFFKRAVISISRSLGKSIILLLLVIVLGSIVSGALAVSNAIINADANLRRNMRPIVTFEFDWDAFAQENDMMTSIPEPIPSEVMIEIGNLSYVNHFDYSYRTSVGSFELEDYWDYLFGESDTPNSDWIRLALVGSSHTELTDVTEGMINLIDGRMFTSSEINEGAQVAIISSKFAQVNQLTTGSIFQVSNVVFNQSEGSLTTTSEDDIFERIDYELEVIGIFDVVRRNLENLNEHETHQELNRLGMLAHRIYVPNAIAKEAQSFTSEQERLMIVENDLPSLWLNMETINAFFVLENSLEIDIFKAIAQPMLPDFWVMIDLTDTFSAISTSMETLQDIADLILWIAILGMLVVLNLLITLFLHDRRHEIGIYLALGEKRLKIIMQIVLEVVVIALVGITFAVFIGNLVSGNISQSMIQAELIDQRNNISSHAMFFDPNDLVFRWSGMAVEEMLEAFDISLDLQTTLTFYNIGLFVVILSTILPVMYLIKMNPKKVLM